MEEKLNRLFIECIDELKKIGIDIKVNTKITKKGKIIFTNLDTQN